MFIKSILAGICIAIGTLVYLSVNSPIIGAFLFSIGLFTILQFKFNLYTGKVAYVSHLKDIKNIIIIFIGNLIGCCILLAFPSAAAGAIVTTKLAFPWFVVLFKAILCGIMIYIAVEGFKANNLLITLLAVPTFILCGAEHSIANMCFLIAAYCFTFEAWGFIILVAIGNAIGSILFHQLIDFSEKI